MRIEISGDSRAWWRFSTDELRQLPRAFDFDFLHRVHRRDRQAENFENRGIFRFDPPIDRREEFGTLYASTSPAGALFEALGSIRPLPEHLVRERVITRLLVGDPFVIADLTVEDATSIYGRLAETRDFALTQDFAAALWDADFMGVKYLPSYRRRPGEFSVALFAPPGMEDKLLKSDEPEPISKLLLNEIKERFDIDVIDSGPLPW
jgi:hypothetical protein